LDGAGVQAKPQNGGKVSTLWIQCKTETLKEG
jgi:hypothetical protein